MRSLLRRLFATESLVKPDQRSGPLPDNKQAYGDVVRIALPAIAELVLMSLIGSADTIMVGQLGKNALAAVSLPGQPRMIMLALFFALNVGVTAIVARRKGEDRRETANQTLRNAMVLSFFLSVVIAGLAITFAEPLMRLAGGHTHTIVLTDGPDQGTPVDTGFIVMNHRNYPLLTRLLDQLGVALRDSEMSFGYWDAGSNLQYSGGGLNGLFAQRRNLVRPTFLRMVRDIFRFFREAERDLAAGALRERRFQRILFRELDEPDVVHQVFIDVDRRFLAQRQRNAVAGAAVDLAQQAAVVYV